MTSCSVQLVQESPQRLHEIKFVDLFLGETASWLTGVPQTSDPSPVPPACDQDLVELRRICHDTMSNGTSEDFNVRYGELSFRASLLRSLNEDVFVLRRAPPKVEEVENLGLHPQYVNMLMERDLRGLVVIAGAYGQGKTTTASSILVSRIAKFGGVAVCIEDPPEMPMEGRRGKGVIYQRKVEKGGFAHEMRQAARWAPNVIFLGEVRDAETAVEALRASINGRLVICTIHSFNVISAIDRIYTLGGSNDDIASLMASGLSLVVHQRLINEPKRPALEVLMVKGEENAGVQNTIRMRKFEQLNSVIQLQRDRIMMKKA